MGGGQSTQDTSSQSVTQIPQWMQQAGQQNYAYAQDVANRPLQQYQGQMVADTAPQTQQFWNLAAASPGVGQGQFQGSTAGFLNALGQTPNSVSAGGPTMQVTDPGDAAAISAGQLSNTNLAPYMNPYTKDVINATIPIMQQQNALSQDQLGNAASSARAFGGSRQGVQQGVAQAQGAQNIGQMLAQLNQANYAQAQGAAGQDIANRLTASQSNQASQQQNLNRNLLSQTTNQAANAADLNRSLAAQTTNQGAAQAKINSDILASQGLGNLGNTMNSVNASNAGLLSAAGASQSMQAQNQINAQMAKFQQANQYPQQQLATLLSALGMTPHDTSTTGQSNVTTTTPTDWASILTGGLGAAADIFKPSDKNVKKNITSLGSDPMTGIPIKSFNYKGQPQGAPKIVGPLAQDVEKAMPGSTAKIGGVLAVPKPHLAAATPSIASLPSFAGNSPSANLSRYMPAAKSVGSSLTKAGAGARAFGGLANTKRRPSVVGGLGA
jgi:Chaperone of endosialidase